MSFKSCVELCCNSKWFSNASDNSPTYFLVDTVCLTCDEGTLCKKVKNATKYFGTGCSSVAGISYTHSQKCNYF